ncbi:MAG TPA: DUF2242 domain-containing protein [Ottowia sp.]|nr:DUF2242 domain-containing protein [Ottowia sp.]HOZ93739.1 DUF2242 domain-containing protein [Ottowia sp.]HQQ52406.1 DUF2242 domain-containing protein [Ottowia sp.]
MSWVVMWRRWWVGVAPWGLTACVGWPAATAPLHDYQPERFDGAAYVRHFKVDPTRSCEAARRALLSQGYVVTSTQAEQVSGRKYFQPSPEHHVQLEFRVVCASETDDAEAAVVFVSGLREQYIVRKNKESASVGVGGLGSLSLPVEGSMDSMVKVASETVTDAALYRRFFELLGTYLDRVAVPERRTPQAATPERLS